LSLPFITDLSAEDLVGRLSRGLALEVVFQLCSTGQELTDAGILVNGEGFFIRKLLGPVRVNPPTHPTHCPHQLVLRLSAAHDGMAAVSAVTRRER
jgi:hypothetical protein